METYKYLGTYVGGVSIIVTINETNSIDFCN